MSDPPTMLLLVRYVVSFQQPTGGHPHREHQLLEAESDEEVMRAVKARWSRNEVVAVRWDDGRGQQRRVWIRL